jgi:tetracycline resistance efflux pump
MSVFSQIIAFLPAALVIVLALVTKKVHFSLCIGIYVGAIILCNGNVLTAIPTAFRDYIIPPLMSEGNIRTLIIIVAIQGLAKMLKVIGAGPAMARLIRKGIKTKRGAEVLTTAAGFAFIYTEPCFLLGVVMRPITEAYKVTKIKLAYICDSLGCNMAALSPVCSYGPYYVGLIAAELTALGLSGDGWAYYGGYWVRNFYSIIAIAAVYFVCISGKDIGSLWLAEKRADVTGRLTAPGDVPLVVDNGEGNADESKPWPVRNFVVPMVVMLIALFACVFWDGDVVTNGVLGAFRNCTLTLAIAVALIIAGFACIAMGAAEKMFSVSEGFQKWLDGCNNAMSVILILVLAWALSKISTALDLKGIVGNIIASTGFPPALIPAIIFLVGAVLSFATGSSWGTAALLMPISVPICYEYGLGISVGAACAIAGGLFGDHCSPISDTTIKASMASECDHIAHVSSQLPYALTAGVATFLAYLVEGLTNSLVIALVVGIGSAIAAITVMSNRTAKKYADYDFSAEEAEAAQTAK